MSATKDSKDKPLFEQEQVKNAKQIMKPFVLRRLKTEVLRDLPKKNEEVIKCPMIEKQKDMYANLISEFSDEANQNHEINGVGMMMQLRKLANHPLLFRAYYTEDKLKVGTFILIYIFSICTLLDSSLNSKSIYLLIINIFFLGNSKEVGKRTRPQTKKSRLRFGRFVMDV